MKRAFNYIDENMIRKIITTFIRPKLEYAAVLWNPHHKKDIEKLEKVQRAATKWAPTLKDQEYNERLDKLKLQTLQERRTRGDMITLYKCITVILHIDKENYLTYGNRISRGNSKKLRKQRGIKDIMKYGFPNRVIDKWNKLPDEVVCAKNINQFKKLYDNSVYGATRA